jgi:adenosylmethionine-8-amino-7-oxononanoate aminotransferase
MGFSHLDLTDAHGGGDWIERMPCPAKFALRTAIMVRPEPLRRFIDSEDRQNVLLIFDEIFMGFCRTGEAMFASQASGVTPDIVTLSKALTGGTLSLGLSEISCVGWHNGKCSCLRRCQCIARLFETEPHLEQARAIGDCLRKELKPAMNIKGVVDVRVLGAIGVIELDRPVLADWFSHHCAKQGVWFRPFGHVVYTTPPLVTELEAVSQIANVMVSTTRSFLSHIVSRVRNLSDCP